MKQTRCATLELFDAKSVDVELSITKGLPAFSIVGLPSSDISESKDRIKSALLHSDFTFPPKKITVNLAPSELHKSGSHFDLSIALLLALYDTSVDLKGYYIFGELGLDGEIKPSSAIFALILSLAKQKKIQKAIVPKAQLHELTKIPGIEFYGYEKLKELLEDLKANNLKKEPFHDSFSSKFIEFEGIKYFYEEEYEADFSDVKGQERAKRAALISAAGRHSLLLVGSPGVGKSMIAKRLRYILPPLSSQEILEIAKLQTIQGKTPTFKATHPYVASHHSATKAAIFGGGSRSAQIGEVGLAHLGELFFDELPHFSKSVLEALREPLQDRVIRIARVHTKVEYECDFVFVGAMNPCPCGNLLDEQKECRCSDLEVQRYKNRLSDPFLDRIDLHVTMQKVATNDTSTISSKAMHKMVQDAFLFRLQRGQKVANANLAENEIEHFCQLSSDAQNVLEGAIERFSLSFRSIGSIKKVARTIADLDASQEIQKEHLLEALSFRKRS